METVSTYLEQCICGQSPRGFALLEDGKARYQIRCGYCGCETRLYKTIGMAISAWNDRILDEPKGKKCQQA